MRLIREDDGESDQQHGGGDCRRLRVVELLEPDDDEEGRDLRDEGNVSGDEDHRAVLADRARESQREAGEDGGHERGQHDPEHGLAPAGAERRRGLLDLTLEIFKHRLHGTDHEGQSDENQRNTDAPGV